MRHTVRVVRDDNSKERALLEFQDHLNHAQKKRDMYSHCIDQAKQGTFLHLIFDFAEQFSIPSSTRQV